MSNSKATPVRSSAAWFAPLWVRLLFVGAAAEAVSLGTWMLLRPEDLLAFLHTSSRPDSLFLIRCLAGLTLVQGLGLGLAWLQPRYRDFAWTVLATRTVEVGMGVFLLATERIDLPEARLLALTGRSLLWVVLFLIVLGTSGILANSATQ